MCNKTPMTESQKEKCKGYLHCERDSYIDGYCKFHLPVNHKKVLTCDQYDDLLMENIKEAVADEEGNYALHWHGFNFPKDHVLFGSVKYEEFRDRLSKSWINIQESNIQDIFIATLNIRELIISYATIHGKTKMTSTQKKQATATTVKGGEK